MTFKLNINKLSEHKCSSKEKGDLYEKYIKQYLINEGYNNIYLWHEIPLEIFKECGIFDNYNKKRQYSMSILEQKVPVLILYVLKKNTKISYG